MVAGVMFENYFLSKETKVLIGFLFVCLVLLLECKVVDYLKDLYGKYPTVSLPFLVIIYESRHLLTKR